MKKMKTIFAAVFAVAMLGSCAKSYTCTCTYGGVSTSSTATFAKKADAQAWCNGSATSYGSTYTCALK